MAVGHLDHGPVEAVRAGEARIAGELAFHYRQCVERGSQLDQGELTCGKTGVDGGGVLVHDRERPRAQLPLDGESPGQDAKVAQ
ncbi:MAG: hypothetical protein ABSA65_11485 [Acidimicrobiales bacterium]